LTEEIEDKQMLTPVSSAIPPRRRDASAASRARNVQQETVARPTAAMLATELCVCGSDPALGAIGGRGRRALAELVGTGGYEDATTEKRKEHIVRNCMRTRDYSISS
jgi:hypothetical protein